MGWRRQLGRLEQRGEPMSVQDFLGEFEADWRLLGRSAKTVGEYCRLLADLDSYAQSEVSLAVVKAWLAVAPSKEAARYRGRAVRAFGKWAETHDGPAWDWWRQVPLVATPPVPQETVTVEQYRQLASRLANAHDRLLVELLWCTGLRLSELVRLEWDDLNLADGYAVVRTSKTNKPRLVPLSDQALRTLRRVDGVRHGRVFKATQRTLQRTLRRLGAPTAHAFRRGWAVNALQSGVSQVSVQAAGGWNNSAMVSRYVLAVSSQLAIHEFRRHL